MLSIPFRIPDTQWKICEKFSLLFCFPKQTIRTNCRHKALGIALMRGGGSQCLETLSKIYQNHAFIYTAVNSDKNSLNPRRTRSVLLLDDKPSEEKYARTSTRGCLGLEIPLFLILIQTKVTALGDFLCNGQS